MRWQNGLEVRDESLCESHRSAAGDRARARASLECVQQYFILIMFYIERSQVQAEKRSRQTNEKELERMRIVGEVDAELNMMEIRSLQVTAIREMERYIV